MELDELVVAGEALPLAREKELFWRLQAEQAAGELSAVRRRFANVALLDVVAKGFGG